MLHVHRGKFDQMPHSRRFGSVCRDLIAHGNLRAVIDEEELVHAFQCSSQGSVIAQIPFHNVHAITK
jgi:hypothetical protein